MNSSTSQLVRHSLARTLAIALIILATVAGAYAQVPNTIPTPGTNPGTDVGDQGITIPHGMVRVTATGPAGTATDYWVADTASGFCRIDQTVNPATGVTSGSLNLATCFLAATGAPSDYQVENGFVFVADMSTGGVNRFSFTTVATPSGPKTAIATVVPIFNSTSLLGNVAVGIHPRVEIAKLGPDGKLYITFPGNGDIWRVLNPLSPTFTQAGNKVERVGTSDNGRRIDAFAWIGHDLWLEQAGFLNRLQNADKCNYTAACVATLEFGNVQSQLAMASDQRFSTDTTGHHMYFGSGNAVVDYDTSTQQTMTIVSNSGNLITGAGTTSLVATSLIQGLNLDQKTGDFLIVDDPAIEAVVPEAALPVTSTGRLWVVPAGVFEPCGPAPTCSMTSQVGNSGPVFAPQQQAAARRAVLLMAGVTHPRGLLFLGDRYWVSDELQGFCRIDVNPSGSGASLSNCYKPTPTFIPGQADATDGAALNGTRIVYVPDASGGAGIARFNFNPANGGTLTQTGVLSSGTSAAEVVALPKQIPGTTLTPEDALYIGFSNNGAISKITKASTSPSALTPVANTENGVGVISMAFYGSDLYMAEEGTPVLANGNVNSVKRGSFNTIMPKASPSMQKGTAVSVAFPSVRGQALGLVVQNPLAIAIGPTFERPLCLGPPGVAVGNIVTFMGTPTDTPAKDPNLLNTAPAMYVGASAIPTASTPQSPQGESPTQDSEVDQWDITCQTQANWVDEASVSPLLSLNIPIASVTAIAVSSHTADASMAIADDPTAQVPDPKGGLAKDPNGVPLTTPTSASNAGQGHIYLVLPQ